MDIVTPADRWGRTPDAQIRALRDADVRDLAAKFDPPRPGTAAVFMAGVAEIDAKWDAARRGIYL